MHQRILVPLDGSKVGEAALPVIEELISKLSPAVTVEVTLFQSASVLSHWVVAGDTPARVPYTEKELEIIKREARKYLKKAGEGLEGKGATVKTEVSFGNAAEEILKLADRINAGMIAMSTQGRHGISRWAFGSITSKVLREAKIPVLTVRAPKETEKEQR